MMTYSTRHKLAQFLLEINEGERQIEIIRQILCEQELFEPYAAFKRIDRLEKGRINARDIMHFLQDNKVLHNEKNCELFIKRYDQDGDGNLVYSEFLTAVITLDNQILRTIATQRPNYEVKPDEYLAYDVEYSLTKLLDKEICFYLDLDNIKQELFDFQDFSYANAFACIDRYSTGVVDFENLKAFLKGQCIYPADEEIIAILRRIDKNDDALISLNEFSEVLEPVSEILKSVANRRNASTRFETPKRVRDSQYNTISSPLRTHSPSRRYSSPLKKEASPTRNVASPSKAEFVNRKIASPSKIGRTDLISNHHRTSSELPTNANNTVNASPLRGNITSGVKDASPLKKLSSEIPLSESTYSRTKSPIRKYASPLRSQQEANGNESSFLSPDAKHGTNSVRRSLIYQDFPGGYTKSPAKASANDNSSYAKKILDSASKGETEAKTPEKRSTSKSRYQSAKKSVKKALSFDEDVTHFILIQTLKQFIILDKDLEIAKQDLALKSDFNLLDFFRTFDVVSRGTVSAKEFEAGLIKYGIYPNKDELTLFFKKIDLDNDGLLRFSDFAETFTPKQKEYANLLHNRTPCTLETALDIYKVFSQDTRSKITNVLKLHLENEGSSESLRQRLKSKGDLSGHEAFKYLDLKGDGFITAEEIFGVFQENDSFLTEREVKLLMDRLDQDRDGKISYYELLREITPKTI